MKRKKCLPMGYTGFDRIEAAFQRVQTGTIPKGELWLSTDILLRAGFEDELDGHINLAKRLEQDLICLPIAYEPCTNRALGYRYFQVDAIQEALEKTDLFVMVAMDGPFQRLSERAGLMKVLTEWLRDRESVLRAYIKEREHVLDLLDRCLEYSAHGVVIAEDLAGDSSTFLSPMDIERYFSSFYIQAVSEIHQTRARAMFHSCGNISKIVPQLILHGFDGLAAIQGRTNDLMSLKGQYGSKLLLMAGIEGELLEKEAISPPDLANLEELLKSFVQYGGWVLSSSCGLYSGRFLERVEVIYRLIQLHSYKTKSLRT